MRYVEKIRYVMYLLNEMILNDKFVSNLFLKNHKYNCLLRFSVSFVIVSTIIPDQNYVFSRNIDGKYIWMFLP